LNGVKILEDLMLVNPKDANLTPEEETQDQEVEVPEKEAEEEEVIEIIEESQDPDQAQEIIEEERKEEIDLQGTKKSKTTIKINRQ